jgi:hypothetical protein
MRLAVAVLIAVLTGTASASARPHSGVFGLVTRGPLTPVCIAERPCSEPVAGALVVAARAGRIVARTRTRADGFYRLRVSPSLYTVRLLGRRADPQTARVRRGRVVRVDFAIDTGIR